MSAFKRDFHKHIYLQTSHNNLYKLCLEINENDPSSALKTFWLCSCLNITGFDVTFFRPIKFLNLFDYLILVYYWLILLPWLTIIL